jgi:hypothetical protein
MLLPLLLQVSATQDVESRVCERLHIGGHISYRRLLEDMAGLGYSNQQVKAVMLLNLQAPWSSSG